MNAILLLSSLASAGKLADGFRGLAYGPASVVENAPLPQGCVTGGTPLDGEGERWVCAVEINGIAVSASYMVDGGYFTGVYISVPSNFAAAAAVYEALSAAYGTCRPKYAADRSPFPECTWTDGTARAVWSYNQYSHKTTVTIFDMDVYAKVEAIRSERARQAASGL